MDNKELQEIIDDGISGRSQKLLKRYHKLKWTRTTNRGHKYLEHPDLKDHRWGVTFCCRVYPITIAAAEKLVTKMEIWQANASDND